jgi:hypothetical protein
MTTHTRIVWPASRFYWSVVGIENDALSPRSRARPSRDYLDSLAEDDLPLPLELLHIVHTPLGDGRSLACAVPKASLLELTPGAISLTPDSIPTSLGISTSESHAFALPELLVDQFEPVELVRERSKRWLLAAAACGVCAMLGTLGLLRRASDARTHADHLRAASIERVQQILPRAHADTTLGLAALQRELADLRSTHAPDTALARSPDAVGTLAHVLAHLPTTTSLRTDVLAVTPATITLSVATDADPQAFLKSLAAPQGWSLDEPRLTVLRGGPLSAASDHMAATTSLAIQMRRVKGGTP